MRCPAAPRPLNPREVRPSRAHLLACLVALLAPQAGAGESNDLEASPLRLRSPGVLRVHGETHRPSAAASDSYPELRLRNDPPPASEPASSGETSLAKQLQNPVADLISVPFQYNIDFDLDPDDEGTRYTLNIQPVIPFALNDDWNLITRTILPIISQHDILGKDTCSDDGLGDIVQSFFLSPRIEGGAIWGVGPVFLWPTATEDRLGARKWGIGPTGVILQQDGPWTYGVLANHIWSYADADGNDSGEVNATFLQPFVSHTWDSGFSLTLNAESTFDWTEDQWTIPLNLMASQVLTIGDQPISLQLGGRYYAERPDGGPEWGIRFSITLLFPR